MIGNCMNRFMIKVDKTGHEPGACWEWSGGTTTKRYGSFWLDGQMRGAHRVSWALFRGEVGDLCVLHRCDNPSCVNPGHLFLGTPQDNTDDMIKKGRHRPGKTPSGSAHWNSKLTEEEVRTIKSSTTMTRAHLARVFSVSPATIYNVQEGITHADT